MSSSGDKDGVELRSPLMACMLPDCSFSSAPPCGSRRSLTAPESCRDEATGTFKGSSGGGRGQEDHSQALKWHNDESLEARWKSKRLNRGLIPSPQEGGDGGNASLLTAERL